MKSIQSNDLGQLKQKVAVRGQELVEQGQARKKSGLEREESGWSRFRDSVMLGHEGQQQKEAAQGQLQRAESLQTAGQAVVGWGHDEFAQGQAKSQDSAAQIREGIEWQELGLTGKQEGFAQVRSGLDRHGIAEAYQDKQLVAFAAASAQERVLEGEKNDQRRVLGKELRVQSREERRQDKAVAGFHKAWERETFAVTMKDSAIDKVESGQGTIRQGNEVHDDAAYHGLNSQESLGESKRSRELFRSWMERASFHQNQARQLEQEAQAALAQASQLEAQGQQLAGQAAPFLAQYRMLSQRASLFEQRGHHAIAVGQQLTACPCTYATGMCYIQQGQCELSQASQLRAQAREALNEYQRIHSQSQGYLVSAEAAREEAADKSARSSAAAAQVANDQERAQQANLEAGQHLESGITSLVQSTRLDLEARALKAQGEQQRTQGLVDYGDAREEEQAARDQERDALTSYREARRREDSSGERIQEALLNLGEARISEKLLRSDERKALKKLREGLGREAKAVDTEKEGLENIQSSFQYTAEGRKLIESGLAGSQAAEDQEKMGLRLENEGYRLLEQAREIRQEAQQGGEQAESKLTQADEMERQARQMIEQGKAAQAAGEVVEKQGQNYLNLAK